MCVYVLCVCVLFCAVLKQLTLPPPRCLIVFCGHTFDCTAMCVCVCVCILASVCCWLYLCGCIAVLVWYEHLNWCVLYAGCLCQPRYSYQVLILPPPRCLIVFLWSHLWLCVCVCVCVCVICVLLTVCGCIAVFVWYEHLNWCVLCVCMVKPKSVLNWGGNLLCWYVSLKQWFVSSWAQQIEHFIWSIPPDKKK